MVFVGRKILVVIRHFLHEVGFKRVQASASAGFFGTQEAIRRQTNFVKEVTLSNAEAAVKLGLADPGILEKISPAWMAWAERPGAFMAAILCEAVGWKE